MNRAYDEGQLDLLSVLTASWPRYSPEFAHACEHVGPMAAIQRLANARVEWVA